MYRLWIITLIETNEEILMLIIIPCNKGRGAGNVMYYALFSVAFSDYFCLKNRVRKKQCSSYQYAVCSWL